MLCDLVHVIATEGTGVTVQDRQALVLTRLVAGKVDAAEAALLLGLSPRSIRRLKARYIDSGPSAS